MSALNVTLLLLATYLVVFFPAYIDTARTFLGTQIDLLPALMVYCGLTANLGVLTIEAIFAGCLLDSLSANPLGTSFIPLFVVGLVVHQKRELLLRDQPFAQFVLGTGASMAAPVMSLLLLSGSGGKPLVGWGTLWQIAMMGLVGGLFTPVFFRLFDRLQRVFGYQIVSESSFRPDREIKRGRA
jgi:cell shape-determining protein MreD